MVRSAVPRFLARLSSAAGRVHAQRLALAVRPATAVPRPHLGLRHFAVEKEPAYVTGKLTGYKVYKHGSFSLQNGMELPDLEIAYETWGELSEKRDNVILLTCGMSASSHAKSHADNPSPGWWEDYIGPGMPLDTNLFFVVCTNNLGGCFGTTGPSSPHPQTGTPWGSRFPRIDVHDMVHAQFFLLDHLGINEVHAVVGSSLGGMLSLCSAALYSERVKKFVSISACAKSFPGSIAFRYSQRNAVMSDPNWNNGDYYDKELPANGLRLARSIGTITYRSGHEWQLRFSQGRASEKATGGLDNEFHIETYLAHQGEKWVGSYDPNSLLWISKAMDGFTMELPDEHGNPCLKTGLAKVHQPALVIGVQHDVLFPVWQQKQISDVLKQVGNPRVTYYELDSYYGHDAFLLESHCIGPAVKGHLEQEPHGALHIWQGRAETALRMLRSVSSRGNEADALRDIFRSLAGGAEKVHYGRLRKMVQECWYLSDEETAWVCEELPHTKVTLDEFMQIYPHLLARRDQSTSSM